MKAASFLIVSIFSLLVFSACASTDELAPLSSIKPGTAEVGTFANEVLVEDTSQAIYGLMGAEKNILKFVIQQPVGKSGQKAWRELWVFDAELESRQFIVTFREDGRGSADFEIQAL